jgi:hypothetical protein
MPPKRNADGSASTVTMDGRYAVLRTPKLPPFRYTTFHLDAGLRYVLGGTDRAEAARELAQQHAQKR